MIASINLVMTVIGFAVSTMFIVFVCTRLICARIQLNASRREFPNASTTTSSIPIASRSNFVHIHRGLHGMDPAVVATFPTKKYRDCFFSYGEDSQCTVCLAEYQEKDILRILPYCQHSFHMTCIDTWLQQHSTCPVCRISLRVSPERKHMMQPMFSSAVRSNSTDSLDSLTYNVLYTNHVYSSRSLDSPRMEPIQEDHFASELDAAENGECTSDTEGNQIWKDSGHHDSETSMARVHPIHTSP